MKKALNLTTMITTTKEFYKKVLTSLLNKGSINIDSNLLVVCGGNLDKETLMSESFKNVTISNLDVRMDENGFYPYRWSFQDVEELSFTDNQFDWVLVHNGLHHCYSPHKALMEMLRVAKIGIVVVENKEGLFIKIGKALKLSSDYEFEAVINHNYEYGGVANSSVPNFIYRWTEREVEKVVNALYPAFENKIEYFYGLRVPVKYQGGGSVFKRLFAIASVQLGKIFSFFLPKEGNQFAFAIVKSKDLKKWIVKENERLSLDRSYK
jgi:ubiquinone/menaquinone biosynthesis C-methylase UbiE